MDLMNLTGMTLFRNSELLEFCHWRGMNDAKLIFVFPYFHFCLHAKAVMVAHFYFVIEGIK